MPQDYRLIRDALEQGKYTMQGNWEKIGPLLINNGGGEVLIGFVQFQGPLRLQVGKGGRIEIGDYTSINYGVEIHSKKRVVIGRYCLIGWNVTITDTHYNGIGYNPPEVLTAPLEAE